jgi:hypothetical protein
MMSNWKTNTYAQKDFWALQTPSKTIII